MFTNERKTQRICYYYANERLVEICYLHFFFVNLSPKSFIHQTNIALFV